MTCDEVMSIVRSSTADDWIHFDGIGTSTFRADVNLRIVENREGDDFPESLKSFQEPWTACHPDPKARRHFYRVMNGSSPVHAFTLVSVDGGRALLPLPKGPERTLIPRDDYLLAVQLDTQSSLDEYIQRSGLAVEA